MNLEVVEIVYMEGEPNVSYHVVDRDVTDRVHIMAWFLSKADADSYARTTQPSEKLKDDGTGFRALVVGETVRVQIRSEDDCWSEGFVAQINGDMVDVLSHDQRWSKTFPRRRLVPLYMTHPSQKAKEK